MKHQGNSFDVILDNWINPKAVSAKQDCHRGKIVKSLLEIEKGKLNKNLEIEKSKANKNNKNVNCSEGNLVQTNSWNPFFIKSVKGLMSNL